VNSFFETSIASLEYNELVINVVDIIYDNSGNICVADIEKLLGISPRQLERLFKNT
jgi:SepF-like predicted cell division protein (DUF552 family)